MRKQYRYYSPLILQKIGYPLFFLAYKIFVRLEIKGKENLLGLKQPIILAPNHTKELDVTTLPLLFPFFSRFLPLYFVMFVFDKDKTFGWRKYFYGSGFLNLLGGYPKFSGHKNYAVALEDHVALLKLGRTVCIFPEGMMTRDGEMNVAHGGLGFLVHTTGATVVPVAIDTFFNMSAWDFFTRKRKVTVTVLPPISASELLPSPSPAVDDFRAASQKVIDTIAEVLS